MCHLKLGVSDVNECQDGTHACGLKAVCSNTPGWYACQLPCTPTQSDSQGEKTCLDI